MLFVLDDRIEKSSVKIFDSTLSEVRLKNNKKYPWIILIPRVDHSVTEIFQLDENQQVILLQEMAHYSRVMKKYFQADKINIGALGNIVSQLHIHIVARFKNDGVWPQSIWQSDVDEMAYSMSEQMSLVDSLRGAFCSTEK